MKETNLSRIRLIFENEPELFQQYQKWLSFETLFTKEGRFPSKKIFVPVS
jgi:hypothetical protein